MNSSYTTILLRGATFEQLRHIALPLAHFLVQDAKGEDVVLYPEFLQDAPRAADLIAATLAAALPNSVVLLSEVLEGEKLRLRLWERGIPTDEYIAEPGYDSGEELPPSGGDAARFCAAFSIADAQTQDELSDVFRAGRYDEFYGFNNAQERHRDIAELLGLPSASVGMGYAELDSGAVPEGVSGASSVLPVVATGTEGDLQEYVLFTAPANTTEAQIAGRFLPNVIALDDDFLGEESPMLGSREMVRQHFLGQGWKSDTLGDLLRYQDETGLSLVAELCSSGEECSVVSIWSAGKEGGVPLSLWESLCKETVWGIWDYRTGRVVLTPAP